MQQEDPHSIHKFLIVAKSRNISSFVLTGQEELYPAPIHTYNQILLSQYAVALQTIQQEGLLSLQLKLSKDKNIKYPLPLIYASFILLNNQKQYEKCIRLLLNYLDKRSVKHNHVISYNVSMLHKKLLNYKSSLFYLQSALKQKPIFQPAIFQYVSLLVVIHRQNQALQYLKRQIQDGNAKVSQSSQLRSLLIKYSYQLKLPFQQVLKIFNGKNVTISVAYNLGLYYKKIKEYTKAKDIFEQIIQKFQLLLKDKAKKKLECKDEKIFFFSKVNLYSIYEYLSIEKKMNEKKIYKLKSFQVLKNLINDSTSNFLDKYQKCIMKKINILNKQIENEAHFVIKQHLTQNNKDNKNLYKNNKSPKTKLRDFVLTENKQNQKQIIQEFNKQYQQKRKRNDKKLKFLLIKEKQLNYFFNNLKLDPNDLVVSALNIDVTSHNMNVLKSNYVHKIIEPTQTIIKKLKKQLMDSQLKQFQKEFQQKKKLYQSQLQGYNFQTALQKIMSNLFQNSEKINQLQTNKGIKVNKNTFQIKVNSLKTISNLLTNNKVDFQFKHETDPLSKRSQCSNTRSFKRMAHLNRLNGLNLTSQRKTANTNFRIKSNNLKLQSEEVYKQRELKKKKNLELTTNKMQEELSKDKKSKLITNKKQVEINFEKDSQGKKKNECKQEKSYNLKKDIQENKINQLSKKRKYLERSSNNNIQKQYLKTKKVNGFQIQRKQQSVCQKNNSKKVDLSKKQNLSLKKQIKQLQVNKQPLKKLDSLYNITVKKSQIKTSFVTDSVNKLDQPLKNNETKLKPPEQIPILSKQVKELIPILSKQINQQISYDQKSNQKQKNANQQAISLKDYILEKDEYVIITENNSFQDGNQKTYKKVNFQSPQKSKNNLFVQQPSIKDFDKIQKKSFKNINQPSSKSIEGEKQDKTSTKNNLKYQKSNFLISSNININESLKNIYAKKNTIQQIFQSFNPKSRKNILINQKPPTSRDHSKRTSLKNNSKKNILSDMLQANKKMDFLQEKKQLSIEFEEMLDQAASLQNQGQYGEAFQILTKMYKSFKKDYEKQIILLALAYNFEKQSMFDEAEKTYLKCCKFNNYESFMKLGQLQIRLNKIKNGVQNLEKANCIKRFNKQIQTKLVYGYSLSQDTIQKALSLASDILKRQPQSLQILIMTVNILQKQGRIKEALEIAIAIDNHKQSQFIKHYIGILYLSDSNVIQAFKYFQGALQIKSNHVPSLIQIATILSQLKPKQAISILEKALQIQPNNRLALTRLGKIYQSVENNPEKAMNIYRKTLETKTNYQAYMKIGDCMEQNQCYLQALINYKEALNLKKTYQVYSKIAEMHQKKEEHKKAVDNYQLSLSLLPKQSKFYQIKKRIVINMCRNLLILLDFDTIISLLEDIIETQDVMDAYMMLGKAYSGKGQYSVALEYYQKANQLTNDENIQLLQSIAICFDKKQEFFASKQIYQKILQIDPENTKVINNLANIHLIIGNTNQAFYWFQIMLQKMPKNIDKRLKVCDIYSSVGDLSKVQYHLLLCYKQKEHDIRVLQRLVNLYKEKRQNKLVAKYQKKLTLLKMSKKVHT